MLIVSACLAGVCCRYDGKTSSVSAIKKLVDEGQAIPVCPEVLGGLTTPRIKSERVILDASQMKVVNELGEDVTSYFINGAEQVVNIAQEIKPKYIIFKSKSPSCGPHRIYDGTFSGELIQGEGICTQMLREAGYKVINEEDYLKGGQV